MIKPIQKKITNLTDTQQQELAHIITALFKIKMSCDIILEKIKKEFDI